MSRSGVHEPPRRAVRLVLHALPAAFRLDYGGELEHDLEARWREWSAEHGWRGRFAFWLWLACDLLRVAGRQRGEALVAWLVDRPRRAARRRLAWAKALAYAAGGVIGFVVFCYSPLCPFCP